MGFATVTAVDHGLINLSSNPYVQIKLRGTDFCLGVLNRKEAKQWSNLIIYRGSVEWRGTTKTTLSSRRERAMKF